MTRLADRAQFVTGRAIMRLVAARALDVAPAEVALDSSCHHCGGDHGKPRLAGPSAEGRLAFSVSHTPSVVLVAVTDGPEVGVDVQPVRDLDDRQVASIGSDFLTGVERMTFRTLPLAQRTRALAVWWTRKEAVLKAFGEGLLIPPSQLTVTEPGAPPVVTGWGPDLRALAGGRPRARLHDLSTPSLAGCLAVLTRCPLSVTEHDGDALLDAWAQRGVA